LTMPVHAPEQAGAPGALLRVNRDVNGHFGDDQEGDMDPADKIFCEHFVFLQVECGLRR
jgi:hypothetical protein